jgi:putative tryptophan/tyrosine transport system substrate-binding protein
MRRRDFITLVGGAAATHLSPWPMVARAQQPAQMRRLGVLMNGAETDQNSQRYLAAFQQALRPLGWIEGKSLSVDVRWTAGDPERTRVYAPELVSLAPDVILSASSPNLVALRRLTRTVPIVFTLVTDPVAQGFVSSLSHPDGNITGFTAYEPSMASKWVDLLKQIAPSLARVCLMFNPDVSVQSKLFWRSIEATASSFGLEATAVPVRSVDEIETGIAGVALTPSAGLIVPTDGFLTRHRQLLVELVARHRIPAVYPQRQYVDAGGLMFYGTNLFDQFRQSAIYVDRILKGMKPGDLPIQQPTKFDLIINLRAARALGIELPIGLMLQASEVIE